MYNTVGLYVNKALSEGLVTATENYCEVVKHKFHHPEGYTLVRQELTKKGAYYRFEDQREGIDMYDYNLAFD